MRARLTLALLVGLTGTPANSEAALRPALALEVFPQASPGPPRSAVTIEALARLVDLDALALSPDGATVAFRLRAPDPQANTVRTGWFAVGVRGGIPRFLAPGGDLELGQLPDGLVAGSVRPPAARWSPDGRWLAASHASGGGRGLQIIGPGGSPRRTILLAADIRRFWWLSAREIGVATDAVPRAALAEARQRDRAHGALFDERFTPGASTAPREVVPPASGRFTIDAETGAVRTGAPEAAAGPDDPAVRLKAADGAGWLIARVAHLSRAGVDAPLVVEARRGAGRTRCDDPRCRGAVVRLWRLGDHAVFQRREGLNNQADAFYAWRPGGGRVRTVRAATDEAFDLCEAAGPHIVCRLESPARPGRLVRLEVASGRVMTLADPNPTLAWRAGGRILRLEWSSAGGTAQFGYLTLPGQGGAKLPPLVVVGYRPRGFQRGGVGDEYPIAALAAAGLAVLNVDRPNAADLFERIVDADELYRAVLAREATDRARLHDGLLAGVACAASLGLADPARLGIGGLSDAAVTAFHAVTHGDRFAAAVASSPAWDPSSWFLVSPANRRQNAAAGLARPLGATAARWARLSPARKAARIRTPLLLNLADHELAMTAELLASLEAASAPHEAHVHADEFHLKWQPSHRLAIYRRNLDWYRFWLQGHEDHAPAKAEQYRRWRALRALAPAPAPQPAIPAPRFCQARSQHSTAR